jgi:hypothetical protein
MEVLSMWLLDPKHISSEIKGGLEGVDIIFQKETLEGSACFNDKLWKM